MLGISPEKLLIIAAFALIVLGPERLPQYAEQAGRLLRQLRRLAQDASADLHAELGPELGDLNLNDLRDLHPRRMVPKFLLDEEPASEQGSAASRPPHTSGAPLPHGERAPIHPDTT